MIFVFLDNRPVAGRLVVIDRRRSQTLASIQFNSIHRFGNKFAKTFLMPAPLGAGRAVLAHAS